MPTDPLPLRYSYSGSYTDPARHHFGSGDWVTHAEIRRAVSNMLRDPAIRQDSIRIVMQHKRSRWSHLKNGSVAELFPDLVRDYEWDRASNAIAQDANLPSRVRTDIDYALRHGVSQALDEARQLVNALEKLEKIRTIAKQL